MLVVFDCFDSVLCCSSAHACASSDLLFSSLGASSPYLPSVVPSFACSLRESALQCLARLPERCRLFSQPSLQ